MNGVCTPINIYDDDNVGGGQRPQFTYGGKANVIPPARLDPVALAYDKMFYPTPNNTSGGYNSCTHANNCLYALPVSASERQGIVRADYRASDRDSFVARYAYYYNATNNGTNGGGLPGLYSYRNDTLNKQTAVLSETHIFKPTLLNHVRVGMMRNDFSFQAASAGQNIASKIGLPNDAGIEIPLIEQRACCAEYYGWISSFDNHGVGSTISRGSLESTPGMLAPARAGPRATTTRPERRRRETSPSAPGQRRKAMTPPWFPGRAARLPPTFWAR